MTGVWVLFGALAAVGVIIMTIRVRDGRFRMTRTSASGSSADGSVPGVVGASTTFDTPDVGSRASAHPRDGESRLDLASELVELGITPGARATLLQFSTAFCAPCRTTRRILADVAATVAGVRHLEVDAESHLELVRRLRIQRTPTVLVLDGQAWEVARASGAPPSRAAVFAVLELAVGEVSTSDGEVT
ncbi:thioredoxin family protein [Frankia sp. Cas3]|uniref:thioredoxin family protein n=1 Tax=Frankia sp. Cas3 TaxID=3073926 RepID=UPI002AD521EA|nr:thioredoxin family protein [Frankia sp. Cas3]